MIQPKPRRVTDRKYLKFVRSKPCVVGAEHHSATVEAHHVPPIGGGKVGAKTDDTRTVPLCGDAHREYHAWGRERFEIHYGVNLEREIAKLNREYQSLRHTEKTPKERPTLSRKEIVIQDLELKWKKLMKQAERVKAKLELMRRSA